jgi:hypothetical protein
MSDQFMYAGIKTRARASLSTKSLSKLMKPHFTSDINSFDYAAASFPWKEQERKCLACLHETLKQVISQPRPQVIHVTGFAPI